jgi:hypothetical protein
VCLFQEFHFATQHPQFTSPFSSRETLLVNFLYILQTPPQDIQYLCFIRTPFCNKSFHPSFYRTVSVMGMLFLPFMGPVLEFNFGFHWCDGDVKGGGLFKS